MITINPGNSFTEWRKAARSLLGRNVHPDEILWEADSLFGGEPGFSTVPIAKIKVPPAFLELAGEVACHCADTRWPLLYRILWRLTHGGEKHLLEITSDPDMAKAEMMAKSVRREIHKMHAFIRFKLISTDEATGRERYAAWFEPDHFVIPPATPFFKARFANMDWSIFTPKGCAHWIGGELSFAPGLASNPVENPDALEAVWSTYYRSIFNPARLKTKMMQTEMPKRYWKNLPEAAQIPDLIAASRPRVSHMLVNEPRPLKPSPSLPYLTKLREMTDTPAIDSIPKNILPLEELKRLSAACRACPLHANATCTVFGEGPANAGIMIVGEQPGDKEDIAGRAFVGPAGRLLDRALAEAGIDRPSAYLTNAVKHFKWKPRGKIRLHQKPDSGEIDACRPWLLGELSNIKPRVLILLGSTAARSVLGKSLAVTKFRGKIDSDAAPSTILTVHPSYLLRIPDPEQRDEEYRKFVEDLRLAQPFS